MPLFVDLVILVDVISVIVGIILLILSWSSLRIIKAKKIASTMFTPILIAGLIFVIGGVTSILHNFMFEELFETIHHTAWAIALIILTYGVYNYWKTLKKLTI